MRIAALAALILLTAPAFAADGPNTATGRFKSRAITMEVRSAVAFRGRSFLDQGDALIVAVSNARLKPDAIADYIDRRRVLEIAGEAAGGRLVGEAFLVREGDAWRVDDAITEFVP